MISIEKLIKRIRSEPWAAILTIALACFAVSRFIVLPALREIKVTNRMISAERETLERLYQQGKHVKTAVSEYEAVIADVPLIEGSWFVLGSELDAITRLEEIAARAGVKQRIHLDTAAGSAQAGEAKAWRRVLVKLDVEGTFLEIWQLVKELEALPQYINIISFQLSSDTRSLPPLSDAEFPLAASPASSGEIIQASITAATYWGDENQKSKIKNQN